MLFLTNRLNLICYNVWWLNICNLYYFSGINKIYDKVWKICLSWNWRVYLWCKVFVALICWMLPSEIKFNLAAKYSHSIFSSFNLDLHQRKVCIPLNYSICMYSFGNFVIFNRMLYYHENLILKFRSISQ